MLPEQAADDRQQMERELKMKTRILLSAALFAASVGAALAQTPSSLGKWTPPAFGSGAPACEQE